MFVFVQRGLLILLVLLSGFEVLAQRSNEDGTTRPMPKEMRGYKIHRARVEMKETSESARNKRDKKNDKSEKDEYDEDEPLSVELGEPELVSATPLGVTFDVPVILPAVKQQGDVDLLVFEDMKVNDTPVTIADHVHPFKLPNKEPLTLTPSVRIFVSTPQAVLRTVDEIFNSKQVWPVTGRVYVCGHFKKLLLKFKRAVPVELQTTITNPLR